MSLLLADSHKEHLRCGAAGLSTVCILCSVHTALSTHTSVHMCDGSVWHQSRLSIWTFETHQHKGICRFSAGRDKPVTSSQHNISSFLQTRNATWQKKKQWLKRVTGSAVISLSWENARDFSSFVRSIQEVISFPINYLPCRKKRKKKKISYLQHEQLSLLSFQNYQNRQCGEASYTVMCVPSHFFDKEQWLPHNSRVSSEVGGGITIIQRHVLSCDKFCFHRPNPLVPLCWKYSELVIEI